VSDIARQNGNLLASFRMFVTALLAGFSTEKIGESIHERLSSSMEENIQRSMVNLIDLFDPHRADQVLFIALIFVVIMRELIVFISEKHLYTLTSEPKLQDRLKKHHLFMSFGTILTVLMTFLFIFIVTLSLSNRDFSVTLILFLLVNTFSFTSRFLWYISISKIQELNSMTNLFDRKTAQQRVITEIIMFFITLFCIVLVFKNEVTYGRLFFLFLLAVALQLHDIYRENITWKEIALGKLYE